MYIRFYNGRPSLEINIEDVDFPKESPVIGPMNIGWTFGKMRLHGPDGYVTLPQVEDCIRLQAKGEAPVFYSDFTIISDEDVIEYINDDAVAVIGLQKAERVYGLEMSYNKETKNHMTIVVDVEYNTHTAFTVDSLLVSVEKALNYSDNVTNKVKIKSVKQLDPNETAWTI